MNRSVFRARVFNPSLRTEPKKGLKRNGVSICQAGPSCGFHRAPLGPIGLVLVGPEFSIKLSERKKNKSGENKARRRRRSMRFPVRLSPPATAAAATAGAVLAAVALRRYLRTRSSMATSAHRRQRQWNHPRGLRQVHGGPASPRRRRRRARSRGGRLRRGYHRVARLRRGRGRGRGLRRRRLHGGAPGVPLREVDALVAQAGLHARPRDAVGARFAWFFLGAV